MTIFYKPILNFNGKKEKDAFFLLKTPFWFNKVDVFNCGKFTERVHIKEIPNSELQNFLQKENCLDNFGKKFFFLMGVLNLTPDSFSDGGMYFFEDKAIEHVKKMINYGVDIIDIGGESTKPKAKPVKIEDLNKNIPLSIDTRKSKVMKESLSLGVDLINDVSSLEFDKDSMNLLEKNNNYVCLMHGGMKNVNIQENIEYDDLILDVYNYLKERIKTSENNGIKKSRIIIDPGIGFRKNYKQDITIIKNLSIFHNLGCPILIGASRKSFIGQISKEKNSSKRVAGSLSVAIEAIRQGVEIIRVHDLYETKQALMIYKALNY